MSTDYITRELMTVDEAKNRLESAGFVVKADFGHFAVSDNKKDDAWFHFDQADNGRIWGTCYGANHPERYVELLNMAQEELDEEFTELNRGAFIAPIVRYGPAEKAIRF